MAIRMCRFMRDHRSWRKQIPVSWGRRHIRCNYSRRHDTSQLTLSPYCHYGGWDEEDAGKVRYGQEPIQSGSPCGVTGTVRWHTR